MMGEWLTIAEVAATLKVSVRLVHRHVEAGRLRAHAFGVGRGAYRVNVADLRVFVARCRLEPARPVPAAAATLDWQEELDHLARDMKPAPGPGRP